MAGHGTGRDNMTEVTSTVLRVQEALGSVCGEVRAGESAALGEIPSSLTPPRMGVT